MAKTKEEKTILTTADIKADFAKRFGEGTFFTFGDTETAEVYPIPTGIPSVDYASGIGGLPLGRIVEIYGPESSGKTTVSLMVISEFQRLAKDPNSPFYGKRAGYIDAEHALDPVHVRALGVDVSPETGMLVCQPDSGEQAMDVAEAICLSNQFGICVVDSVPALVPIKEMENDAEYNPIGLQARLMSQGLRKLAPLAYKHNVLFIFINQLRMKVGQMFGNPETTPGGLALKYYATMRLDLRSKPIEKNGTFIGLETTVKFRKNKVARPFTTATYDYYWDTGVDRVKNIMEVATEMDIIHRAGAYYYLGEDSKNPYKDSMGNELKWQGKDNLLEALRNSPALYNYINDLVLGKIPKDAQFVVENDHEEEEPAQDLQPEMESLI
jgi:recombination protein RecA